MEKRVAIVTAGNDGIGRETCRMLFNKGYQVVSFDINQGKLDIPESEAFAVDCMRCDVTKNSNVQECVEQVIDNYGRIDILVNCVGGSLGMSNPVEEISEDIWDKLLDINLKSVYLCAKYIIPHMKARKYGRIINLSSIAGRGRSFFGSVGYAAAKAGVIGFTRQGSKELGPHGITINVVAPGTVATDRINSFWQKRKTIEQREEYLNTIALGRLGQPNEIAAAIAFLCSEEASYITGAVLDVNGGSFVG